MGWETRRRGGRYYTRSRKEAGRVVREYVGAGELASVVAELDARERREREQARAAKRAVAQRLADLRALGGPLAALAEGLANAALVAAGYRRHRRGEWRKRRGA